MWVYNKFTLYLLDEKCAASEIIYYNLLNQKSLYNVVEFWPLTNSYIIKYGKPKYALFVATETYL